MKRSLIVSLALVFALFAAVASHAEVKGGKISLKAGEEVFVCGCGEKCECDTISMKAGSCSCGKDLVKATVSKVEKGKAIITVAGKDEEFKTTAKYVCACGAGCDCNTVSQKPGKCACGKELKAVKAKK